MWQVVFKLLRRVLDVADPSGQKSATPTVIINNYQAHLPPGGSDAVLMPRVAEATISPWVPRTGRRTPSPSRRLRRTRPCRQD